VFRRTKNLLFVPALAVVVLVSSLVAQTRVPVFASVTPPQAVGVSLATTGDITVSWQLVAGATGYQVGWTAQPQQGLEEQTSKSGDLSASATQWVLALGSNNGCACARDAAFGCRLLRAQLMGHGRIQSR
jgi:hypothetical protein